MPVGRRRRRPRDRAAQPVRRPRRAEPQPARRRGGAHRAPRAQLRGSTSTPTCRASTSSAHGLHEQFRERLAAVLARYGVTELDRTPELEEAVFRIFLAQRRAAADVHLVSSLLQRWIIEPAPADALAWPVRRSSTGWSGPPSCASPSSATWPAACGSAGSTSRWSTGTAPASWPASAVSSRRWPTTPRPTAPPGSTRSRRSPSRSCGSWPSGSRTACRRGSRCSRCWSGGTTASSTCTGCASSTTRAGRPWSPTTCWTRTAPRTWCPRSGRSRSSGTRTGRWPRPSRRRWPRRPEGHEVVVDLYLSWPGERRAPEATSEELATLVVALPFAADVRRIAVAVCPGAGEPGQLLHVPPGAGW